MQETWPVCTMSRVTSIWRYLTISELLPAMLDFWRHTIIWCMVFFESSFIVIILVDFSSIQLVILLFIYFDYQGNAMKDAGRVEEAIHCYRVSFLPVLVIFSSATNLLLHILNFLFAFEAMPVCSAYTSSGTYQSWKYLHGVVCLTYVVLANASCIICFFCPFHW